MKILNILLALIIFSAIGCTKSSSTDDSTARSTITSISPTQGPANTTVTITGTGFNAAAGMTAVTFNGKQATIVNVTSTSIEARVPIAAGTGAVTVTSNGQTSTGQSFIYELSIIKQVMAGTGFWGPANGIGTNAMLGLPTGIVVDSSGNVYLADGGGSTLRKITPQLQVTTMAGVYGMNGNIDGTGSVARFQTLTDVAVDEQGNIFAGDFQNLNVRKITQAGVVTTYLTRPANGVSGPTGMARDRNGNIYLVTPGVLAVDKFSPSGVLTRIAEFAGWSDLYDVTLDDNGNMYVCDRGTHLISKVTPSGTVTTIAGVRNVAGHNNGPALQATFHNPSSLTIDKLGNIYVADVMNNAIRKISSDGNVSTYIPTVAAYSQQAGWYGAYGVAVDKNNVLYVSNTTENRLLKVTFE